MSLQTSASAANPLTINELKTEFTGPTPSKLSDYYVGAGYVANHENNSSIPSSGRINILNFLGADVDFESNTYTDGQYIIDQGTTTGLPFPDYVYSGVCTNIDFGSSWGTMGSINLIGKSKSATTQVTIEEIFDFTDTFSSWGQFGVTGNHTGTWWTSITANGVTKNRSAADFPSGQYFSPEDITVWLWTGSVFGFDGAGTFTVRVVL